MMLDTWMKAENRAQPVLFRASLQCRCFDSSQVSEELMQLAGKVGSVRG